MAALDENFLVAWSGLKSAIGSGDLANWEEYTNGRDRYLEGHATPGTAGGGTGVHGHTGNSHSHVSDYHTHTIGTGAPSSTVSNQHVLTGTTVSGGMHVHSEPSVSADILYLASTVAAKNVDGLSDVDTRPESYTVFWITLKTGETGDIPDDCICFTDDSSAPSGFTILSAADGRFLLGCGSGDSAGADTPGAATHAHDTDVHDHTQQSHTHADGTVGNGSTTSHKGSGFPQNIPATTGHTHAITNFNSTTSGVLTTTGIDINGSSNDPEYTKLLVIQNTSGGESTPVNAILPYMASGAIPSGWEECDGSGTTLDLAGEQVMCTDTGGEVGDTGSDQISTHTHTEDGHGHTHNTWHTHTFTFAATSSADVSSGGRSTAAGWAHTHSSPTCSNVTPTMQDAVATWQNEDGKYQYRTCRWVRYSGAVSVKRAHLGAIVKTEKEVLAG